jgi:hypothetical protein
MALLGTKLSLRYWFGLHHPKKIRSSISVTFYWPGMFPNENRALTTAASPKLTTTVRSMCATQNILFEVINYFFTVLISFFSGSTVPLGPGLCFQFHDHFTNGRTPWTNDKLVARPLPKHKTTQTQNQTYTHTKHTCLAWDSNPRSLLPSERKEFMP